MLPKSLNYFFIRLKTFGFFGYLRDFPRRIGSHYRSFQFLRKIFAFIDDTKLRILHPILSGKSFSWL